MFVSLNLRSRNWTGRSERVFGESLLNGREIITERLRRRINAIAAQGRTNNNDKFARPVRGKMYCVKITRRRGRPNFGLVCVCVYVCGREVWGRPVVDAIRKTRRFGRGDEDEHKRWTKTRVSISPPQIALSRRVYTTHHRAYLHVPVTVVVVVIVVIVHCLISSYFITHTRSPSVPSAVGFRFSCNPNVVPRDVYRVQDISVFEYRRFIFLLSSARP